MLLVSSTSAARRTPPQDTRLVALYDSDCGFCSHTAQVVARLDRRRRLRLLPLQRAAEVAPDAPPLPVLLASMHVRDRNGSWSTGGAAWTRIAREVPLLRPLGLIGGLPVVRDVVERVYAVVAANRHHLSHLLGHDACRMNGTPR
jgi:predicted DCC family thiol-disulfide oxidoreductase YuxK